MHETVRFSFSKKNLENSPYQQLKIQQQQNNIEKALIFILFRSYGRPARNVQLEASFVPYDDDILPDDSVKTLVSRLYFHIFWTDCVRLSFVILYLKLYNFQ